jgi:hypothetical protein
MCTLSKKVGCQNKIGRSRVLLGARTSIMVGRISHFRRGDVFIVNTYPEPETEKERSPIDIPQEWITPEPSRRPDIFPEFERLETPLPKPLPGDPEVPDEEEEEEEEKKKKNPDEDPDEEEENPDQPAPSEE